MAPQKRAQKSTLPYEVKKLILQRWAMGETKAATLRFFGLNPNEYLKWRTTKNDEEPPPPHRDTISKVRDEFLHWDVELARKLVEELPETRTLVEQHRPELRGKLGVPLREHIEPKLDALAARAREEHLAEMRSLIEELRDAVKTPRIDEVYSEAAHPTHNTETKNLTLFSCVKDHLPCQPLWEDYASWANGVAFYLAKCKVLIWGIRKHDRYEDLPEDPTWVSPEGFRTELPILKRIGEKALGNDPAVHFFGVGLTGEDVCLSADGIEVCSSEGGPRGLTTWATAAKTYQKVSDGYLNGEETDRLIALFKELKGLEARIRQTLDEVLTRRDYVFTTCRLCPGATVGETEPKHVEGK